MLISGPEFLIATLLVMLFAVSLGWTPAVAYISDGASATQLARALALPVMTLTFALVGPMTRMTRSAVLNVLTSPAIETAILKGASRARIILLHALPNALSPIFNVIAINLAYLVSGVLVVEGIFAYPGMAKLMVDSVSFRDVPMVQALRDDILRRLRRADPAGGRPLPHREPSPEASQVSSSTGQATVEAGASGAPKRRRLASDRLGFVGWSCIAVLAFWAIVAVCAPVLAPHAETALITETVFAPIGSESLWLGSDYLGRDVLTRLLYGARMTIGLALIACIITFAVGTTLGFAAGLLGGRLDSVLSRTNDAFIAFPSIMLS